MKKRYVKWMLVVSTLIVILVIAALVSITSGELDISWKEIVRLLSEKKGIEYTIIFKIRLPRIILGFAVGGALSLSGVILQGIYRNPLVEPYTLGISGGAAVGVAIAIVAMGHFEMMTYWLPFSGFIGALLSTIIVYLFGISRGEIKIKNMLLVGVMVSFIASSIMMFMLATTTADKAYGIIFWTMGSLEEPNGNLIKFTLFISIFGLVVSYLFARPLNALRLGQVKAKHLGINTNVAIQSLFIISSVLTGVCVSVAGVIGFVGLVVPHIIRSVIGNDYRALLISSFLGGGSFLILSDVVAHTLISPNELPVGVITGIVGGVIFIFILSKRKTGRGGV